MSEDRESIGMSTARPEPGWERLHEVFHAALERDAGERPAYVAAACAGDDALRAAVDRLVAAHERAGDFIAEPIAGRDVARLLDDSLPPLVGRRLGPWRVERELGRGGMGVVYLAARADGEYEGQVAVKLIKRGMDSDLVLRRFRAERQILASLDHPHIARLLDGGTTAEEGLPYFVMEYVDGQPIDAYAEARRLTVPERLALFLQVCDAVAYAHRHLVVHRDVKPVNVLVTADGSPKLLDFGIAKILGDDPDADAASGGGAAAASTASGVRLLTPEYASPEQVEGAPVTTATDVYSLGVLLYVLLTGKLPYRFGSRTPEEVGRVVRTAEPVRPSSAVAGRGASAEDARLRRRLRGDLDTIVLKALRKEPNRRYSSVEQLADDVRRHLAGRPVRARPDTPWYRAGKFVRRNAVAVAAGSLALAALVGGAAAVAWQAREARAQAALARAAQARAERRFADVRKLAHAVLFDYHDAIKDLPGATPVRERLVRDALEYLDTLSHDAAGTDPALRRELAAAYERVGDVQGGTMFANLGDTRGAIASYRNAVAILEASPTRTDAGGDSTPLALAGAYRKLGTLLWETGDVVGALSRNERALTILESLVARAPAGGDVGLRRSLQLSHDYVGMILLERGDATGALAHHRAALAVLGTLPDSVRRTEALRRSLSTVHEHAGADLTALGDLPAALAENRQALAIRAELAAGAPLNADYRRTLAVSHYNDGEILVRMGRTREALASYRADLALSERLMAADPRNEEYRGDVAYAAIRIGEMLAKLGRSSEALASYRRSLALREHDVRADPANLWKRSSLIEAHARLAGALAVLGRRDAALAEGARTRALMRRTAVEPTNAAIRGFFADTYADLARAYAVLATAQGRGRAPDDGGGADCRAAREMQREAADVWGDMARRGILAVADSAKPSESARRIAACALPGSR